MENTGEIHFGKGSKPEWFLAVNDQSVGPLRASDILERIAAGSVTYFHYVWKEGFTDWKRICDVEELQSAKPKAPTKRPPPMPKSAAPTVKKAEPRVSQANQPKEWFLFYNDTQFGPFSKSEVAAYLQLGKIHGKIHVWKDGLDAWTVMSEVAELKDLAAAAKKSEAKPVDRRKASRKPLVARIMMANDSSVVAAVCRDISVGGMQVLTDQIPGKVGSKIKMNVSSAGKKSSKALAPFVAEGVIVRMLEDGRGFSFRFEKITAEARKSIESFIKENE